MSKKLVKKSKDPVATKGEIVELGKLEAEELTPQQLLGIALKHTVTTVFPPAGAGFEVIEKRLRIKRDKLMDRTIESLSKRLRELGRKVEIPEEIPDIVYFNFPDLYRKILSEPEEDWPAVVGKYIAGVINDSENTNPHMTKKAMSTLLVLDMLDLKVLLQFDTQFKANLASAEMLKNPKLGVKPQTVVALMNGMVKNKTNPSLIEQSVIRLEGQNLIRPLKTSPKFISEQKRLQEFIEGIAFSQEDGAYIPTGWARDFLQFLGLAGPPKLPKRKAGQF